MQRLFFILIIALTATACGDLVDGINQDPNNPTSASYQNILTGAEVGNIILNTGETARRAGIFCGYYEGIDRQHLGFYNYSLTTSDFNSLWYDLYVDTYRNALEAEKAAAAEGLGGITQGITQVIQALAIGVGASLYGDIPFAEAGRIEIENPVYEEQENVYAGVQDLLDAAILNLQSGTDRPAGGADIYFDGNPAAWIEVANTLKARFYLQTRDYEAAYAAAGNGISAAENNLAAPHGTGLEASNLSYLFFAIEVRGADVIVDEFIISLLQSDLITNPIPENYRGNEKTDETARFNYYFSTNNLGVQPNTENGFAAQTADAPIATYAENLLIRAEAGLRSEGFATGLERLNEYRSYLQTGGYLLNADPTQYRYDAYDAADFDIGGLANNDGSSAENALLQEILEERYVTFFGQIEGFNDVRRTAKEDEVRVPVPPNTGTAIPERFLYPQTELDRNANTPNPIPGLFEPTGINN